MFANIVVGGLAALIVLVILVGVELNLIHSTLRECLGILNEISENTGSESDEDDS
jgi:hypothetical protein